MTPRERRSRKKSTKVWMKDRRVRVEARGLKACIDLAGEMREEMERGKNVRKQTEPENESGTQEERQNVTELAPGERLRRRGERLRRKRRAGLKQREERD